MCIFCREIYDTQGYLDKFGGIGKMGEIKRRLDKIVRYFHATPEKEQVLNELSRIYLSGGHHKQ